MYVRAHGYKMNDKIKLLAKKLKDLGLQSESDEITKLAVGFQDILQQHSDELFYGTDRQGPASSQYASSTPASRPGNTQRYVPPEATSPWAGGASSVRGRYVPPEATSPWERRQRVSPRNYSGESIIEIKDGVDYSGLDSDAKKAADILALLAEEMGHPPLVMTSGFRGPGRQARAMYNNYKSNGNGDAQRGRDYLVRLYSSQPDNANAVADCFEMATDAESLSCAERRLTSHPMSNHARGIAFDLRNTPGALAVAREAVSRGLISGRVGDETGDARPHVHMKIESVSQEGLAFLDSGTSTTAIV